MKQTKNKKRIGERIEGYLETHSFTVMVGLIAGGLIAQTIIYGVKELGEK